MDNNSRIMKELKELQEAARSVSATAPMPIRMIHEYSQLEKAVVYVPLAYQIQWKAEARIRFVSKKLHISIPSSDVFLTGLSLDNATVLTTTSHW